jgi:hypothetical protein
MLELLPATSIAAAMKDPDAARGSVLKASGTIVEIRTEAGVTSGSLATGGMTMIWFVTGMSTKDVYAQSWASFIGVFVPEYDYENVSGGQTKSLLLAGAFDLPENHASTNGPEARAQTVPAQRPPPATVAVSVSSTPGPNPPVSASTPTERNNPGY